MANNAITSFFSMGSQSKPPTLQRDEHTQWKIRMVSFLVGARPGLSEFFHNPPYVATVIVLRVPATTTTPEVPEQLKPKPDIDWTQPETERYDLVGKCKRLLIMAIPSEIFESLDSYDTSKDLWTELQKQLEGGAKTLKNNRALCINEYSEFQALENEAL